MGIIDRIMYKKDFDKTYVAIVDYKTGNPNISLDNAIYGIDSQLPIYLFLAKNSKLKNIEFIGFYLNKIIHNNSKYNEDILKNIN